MSAKDHDLTQLSSGGQGLRAEGAIFVPDHHTIGVGRFDIDEEG